MNKDTERPDTSVDGMPEGYKRIRFDYESPDLQFKSAYVGAKSDVIDAMDLMKEMAEALERLSLKESDDGGFGVLDLDAEQTLKKWKEWK